VGLVSQEKELNLIGTSSRQHAIMMAPTHWHVSGETVGEDSFLKPEDRILQ